MKKNKNSKKHFKYHFLLYICDKYDEYKYK